MHKKIGFKIISAAFVGLMGLFVLQNAFAATGTIRLAPSSLSVQKGKNFSVNIKADPSGTGIDGIEATISYDKAKVQFVSIDSSGTAFPIELAQSGGNGAVEVTRGHLTQKVSDNNSHVVKVTFKALAGGTSANLSLSGNTTANGSYLNPGTQGASVSLTNPPTPDPDPEPKPDPKPKPSPKPKPDTDGSGSSDGSDSEDGNNDETASDDSGDDGSSGNAPETKPNTPRKTASGKTIRLIEVLFKRARFKVTGKTPFKTYIKYGVGDQLNLSTKTTQLKKQHTLALDESTLVPGTTYSYRVVTVGPDGKTEQTEVQTIKTKGYTLRITVFGKDDKPLADRLVTLYSEPMTARTNDEGVAVFEDVSPGNHTIEYSEDDDKFTQTIEVEDTVTVASATTAEPQVFSVVFSEAGGGGISTGLIAALAVLAVIAVAIVLLRKKFASQTDRFNFPGSQAPTGGDSGVVTGGGSGGQNLSSDAQNNEEITQMLDKVPGAQTSNPGSVVGPENKDGEEK